MKEKVYRSFLVHRNSKKEIVLFDSKNCLISLSRGIKNDKLFNHSKFLETF